MESLVVVGTADLYDSAGVTPRDIRGRTARGADTGGGQVLLKAAEGGQLEIVKDLVGRGVDVNATDNNGWTPLAWAALYAHLDVVKFLVDSGADINATTNDGWTPLIWAARYGLLKVVKYLVERGASMKGNGGRTPLIWAADDGHLIVVKYLVDVGADVNAVDDLGETALTRAAVYGYLDIVEHLVKNGADVNASSNDGHTATIRAATDGHLEVVRFLVEHEADVKTTCNNGETALAHAAAKRDWEVMKYLVVHGATWKTNTMFSEEQVALIEAAADGHLDFVKYLIECGADVNATSNGGETALARAAENGRWEIVQYLVARGADVNATDNSGKTVLLRAATKGCLDDVICLVDCGADVNAVDKGGWTALMWGAANGHLDLVKCLVECGADVNATDKFGQTALIRAARHACLNVVKYLVESGADINAIGKNGQTALIQVTQIGHLDVEKYLVSCGADVNATKNFGWMAVLKAVEFSRLDVIKYLVECGADVNATSNGGETALARAAENGRWEIVQYLVARGADVNATDNSGKTVLLRAATKGCLDDVICLVDCGADVNAVDKGGWTALMWGAANGHLDLVKCLVECGADVNATDSNGQSILSIAAVGGHSNVANYLVRVGIEVNAADNYGGTALIKAAERGHLNVVKTLVDNGSHVNATDKSGLTALMVAAANDQLKIVKYLVGNGADVKAVNNDGITSVAVAARHGNLDIHRMLAQHESRTATLTMGTNAAPSNAISKLLTDIQISPFDLNITQTTDPGNAAADFIATWLDARVALKLFVPDAASTSFYAEVMLWHQLRHPNVLKLYGACDAGHNLFVCEVATKGSVVDYLKACPAENRRPWRYLYHAALGLAYLHERGIIHGDLRGSNILVGDDDQAKVANFGLSGMLHLCRCRETSDVATGNGIVGSMRWQSPEVLEGQKPSSASDVYALGLCIVEILTGKIPWYGGDERWVHSAKAFWIPGSSDNWLYQPADVTEECRELLNQFCCRDPTLRQPAFACVRLFERLSNEENNNNGKKQLAATQELDNMDIENYHDKLSRLWDKILRVHKSAAERANESYACRWLIGDLSQIYDTIQTKSQPPHFVMEAYTLLEDALSLIANTSQTSLIAQLSLARSTRSNVYTLRRRIAHLKRQLRIGETRFQQVNAEDSQTTHCGGDRQHIQDTNLFVSEISKTWLIASELKTSEEQAAFLSYLDFEINRHGAHYSINQRKLMQGAYDDLKAKLDMKDDLTSTLPVWFVPWYELTESLGQKIGSGGFGSVYIAKWLDSDVVVKRINLQHTDNAQSNSWTQLVSSSTSANLHSQTSKTTPTKDTQDQREIFEHEVNIWFNLSHQHVVRLFGACHVGRQPFFVCEYASNGSLDKYLFEHPDEIWAKLHEAALGLLYLHERGIVHCDLKCNNIVIRSDNKAKVTDFGLSLVENVENDGKEKSGKITGAWHWLAPELLLGRSQVPSRESDVYSFGMCIVEALRVVTVARTGSSEREKMPLHRVPWFGIQDKATVKVLMKRNQLPNRPIACTDAQWSLVEKMCKVNPSDRIEMCIVADELSILAGIRQYVNRPTSSYHRKTFWLWRRVPGHTRRISLQPHVLAVAAVVKNHINHARRYIQNLGSRDAIYQIHELLWTRIEDVQMRVDFNSTVDGENWLEQLAVDAKSNSMASSAHSDSLVDFTELALQAYGLHRRLDKLMAALFVRIESDDALDMSVHDWKQQCQMLLGTKSSTVGHHGTNRVKPATNSRQDWLIGDVEDT